MEKVKVLVIGDDARYEIKTKLTHEEIAFLGFAKYGDAALEKARSFTPDAVVLLNGGEEEDQALHLAGELYVSLPGCAVFILSGSISLPFVEKAMQAGVRKVLDLNCEKQVLIESIKQGTAQERSRNRNSTPAKEALSSKVITVFGSKGGIGKSTIAANLAVSLARKNKRVALIDLDLQFGDINLFFDIDPKDTIADLVQEKQAYDIEMIKSYMHLHSSTVSVLCAPQSPEMAEAIQAKSIEKIIDTVRPFFDFVVIDSPPYFNDISIVAIETADVVLTVVTLDIATIRNTKVSLDILNSLNLGDKVRLIVNRDSGGSISIKDVQNILDHPVRYRISSDWKTTISSLNRGVPLVMGAPRTAIGKEFLALADAILNNEQPTKRSKGA